MEIQAAIAKVDSYTSPQEGDKVEIIERPNGGISIIMAEGKLDNQRSKAISIKAVHALMGLISDGIHDGAASRAVLTNLKNEHHGRASVALSVISCDLESQTIIITKNNCVPVVIILPEQVDFLNLESETLAGGCITPAVFQFQLESDLTFFLLSDGICSAGGQSHQSLDIREIMETFLEDQSMDVQAMADFVLNQAISLDTGEPKDDMTVVVFRVRPVLFNGIRRVSIQFPIKPA